MSSISATNSEYILAAKPYLTKSEVAALLDKKGKNLDKKILRLINRNYLLPLKKGFYTTQRFIEKQTPLTREYLANILYYPSYLSLEYVLFKEGLIPEGVYAYTSVTLKTTRMFTNSLGTFLYRSVKPSLFRGYVSVQYTDKYRIKIASRAKALFDYLYFKILPVKISEKQQAITDLRINWDLWTKEDLSEFIIYSLASQSQKMEQVARIIERGFP